MKPRIEQGIVLCPKCGFTADKEQHQLLSKTKTTTPSSENSSGSSLKVMDTDKGPTVLPTTSAECPKCGNRTAFWWMLQTNPLMKRLHNSIGVLDVAIHGEIIPNSRSFHPSNK